MAEYRDHFVAYVDVLGFSDLVSKSATNPKTMDHLVQALHSINPNPINQGIGALSSADSSLFGASVFSDSVIVYDAPDEGGFYRTAANLVTMIERLAVQGILTRGSITFGKLYSSHEKKHPIIFGPALVRAVNLEQTVAKFPRVVLSKEAHQKYLQYETAIAQRTTLRNSYVKPDKDGAYYLNPFAHLEGRFRHDDHSISELANHLLDEIAAKILENLNDNIDAPDRWAKHQWFAEEYNNLIESRKAYDRLINIHLGKMNKDAGDDATLPHRSGSRWS